MARCAVLELGAGTGLSQGRVALRWRTPTLSRESVSYIFRRAVLRQVRAGRRGSRRRPAFVFPDIRVGEHSLLTHFASTPRVVSSGEILLRRGPRGVGDGLSRVAARSDRGGGAPPRLRTSAHAPPRPVRGRRVKRPRVCLGAWPFEDRDATLAHTFFGEREREREEETHRPLPRARGGAFFELVLAADVMRRCPRTLERDRIRARSLERPNSRPRSARPVRYEPATGVALARRVAEAYALGARVLARHRSLSARARSRRPLASRATQRARRRSATHRAVRARRACCAKTRVFRNTASLAQCSRRK